MTIKVVLADNHDLLRGEVRKFLAREDGMEVVGEAADGESALEQARLLKPDVVVMDIYMSGGGGGDATRKIRAELPGVRVIGLSLHEESIFVESMLEAGASGYVAKGSIVTDLVPAIESVAAGKRYVSPGIDGPEFLE